MERLMSESLNDSLTRSTGLAGRSLEPADVLKMGATTASGMKGGVSTAEKVGAGAGGVIGGVVGTYFAAPQAGAALGSALGGLAGKGINALTSDDPNEQAKRRALEMMRSGRG